MRLATFILANIEPILIEWVSFARTITPERDIIVLRDHAAEILRAAARDMKKPQTSQQCSEKSKGDRDDRKESTVLDTASEHHALGRANSGFDMVELLSEYRALRASVIRLWNKYLSKPERQDLDDLTRFNEAIDQSVAIAVVAYTKHVDESREIFLAILGHDLRNPLAALKLAAFVLTQSKSLDANSLKLAKEMIRTTEQMDEQILDLLDFALTRLGQSIPLVKEEMNLEELCKDCVAYMQVAHPSRTIHCTLQGDLIGTWDSRRLWQVVTNLLANALQHGAKRKPVELSVTGEVSDVVINVHNEGKPISKKKLTALFQPVSHLPLRSSVDRPGNIGLGLYIVREIVSSHAGSVHVQSSREAGTDFAVHLPRQPVSIT